LAAFRDDCVWLEFKWRCYQQLFDKGQDRREMLADFAPDFFLAVKDSLADSIILGFSRITDEARTRRHENLTCPQIVEWVDAAWTLQNNMLAEHLLIKSAADDLQADVANMRLHRNKRIAHSDLAHARQRLTIDPIRTADVERAFDTLKRFFEQATELFLGSPTALHYLERGNAESIVYHLQWLKNAIDAQRMPFDLQPVR
jgi:hypothetical protein